MTARERIERLRELLEETHLCPQADEDDEGYDCVSGCELCHGTALVPNVQPEELRNLLPALLDLAEAAMWYSERPSDGLNETRIQLALAKLEGK